VIEFDFLHRLSNVSYRPMNLKFANALALILAATSL